MAAVGMPIALCVCRRGAAGDRIAVEMVLAELKGQIQRLQLIWAGSAVRPA